MRRYKVKFTALRARHWHEGSLEVVAVSAVAAVNVARSMPSRDWLFWPGRIFFEEITELRVSPEK